MPLPRSRTLLTVAAVAAAASPIAVAQAGRGGEHGRGHGHGGGRGHNLPGTIALPAGFQPEGISSAGRTFFVGSRATGAIYRGDLKTGLGSVLVPAEAGRMTYGNKVDPFGRLVAVSGTPGAVTFYDPRTGAVLKRYAPTGLAQTALNDVVVTRKAAYATDPGSPRLVVVAFGKKGALPEQATELPLTGDIQYDDDPSTFESNGIVTAADGSLIIVQSRTGLLFRVDPATGVTTALPVEGGPLTNGDGLLRDGRTLYVVRNRLNQIAVVKLDKAGTSGKVVGTLTDPGFDVPTTITASKGALYAVNGRFTTPPTADTPYSVVRVDGR